MQSVVFRQALRLTSRNIGSEYHTVLAGMYRDDRRGRDYRGQGHWGRGGQRRNSGSDRKFGQDRESPDDGGEMRGGSGRGGYKGYRGRGRGRGRVRHEESGGDFRDNGGNRSGGDGNRHPAGLSGRDIGLWYARKHGARNKQKERDQMPEVKMVQHQEQNIRQLLHDIKSSRECPPQPNRSGAELPPESMGEDWYDEQQNLYEDIEDGTSNMTVGAQSGACNVVAGSSMETEEAAMYDIPTITDIMQYNAEEDYMVKDEHQVTLQKTGDVNTRVLDNELLEDYQQIQENETYKHMQTFRHRLPSYNDRKKIINTIDSNQVVVLSGETGCGKTTQVPQYILDDYIEQGIGSQCRIICTQPRRISAISVAERVAAERAEKCGLSVGYMIRLENKLPRTDGSILYCTTGILLKVLETDPLLHRATHIILDEIHERDLLSDFLIIILRDILKQRPGLKLILMSATLNAEAFSKYFNNSPMINVPGFTYPVEEYLLEDVIELLQYEVPDKMMKRRTRGRKQHEQALEEEEDMEVWLRNMYGGVNTDKSYSPSTLEALRHMDMTKIDLDLVKQLIDYIVQCQGDGAILVFLPGWSDISDLHKMLTRDSFFNSSSFRLIPLHSMMPTLNQREVFERPPAGVRKIVIATNIAETSITIDDVVYVIDAGRIKVKGFTPENNLATLDSELVSRANAKQRRGRAGRVQPGVCYHLYTSLQESKMLDYLPPEILRTRLEELCLQIKYLGLGDIMPFVSKAMQPPSLAALQSAIVNLQRLNAIDSRENLLPLGKHLARMPLDPHTGKMILFGAMFGCLNPILTIAASLNFKDPFFIPLGKESLADQARQRLSEGSCSDHLLLVKAFDKWERAKQRGTNRQLCYDYFMAESTLMMLKKMKDQLADVLRDLGFIKFKGPSQAAANRNSDNEALVKAVVCAGLYPNVAKIKSLPTKYRSMKFHTKHDGKCELHPKSVAKEVQRPGTQWIVFHKKMKTSAVWVYDCSLVSPYSLLFFGGDIKQIKEDNINTVCVDDWIQFKASPDTVKLVKELRQELDYVLDCRITNSKDSNWDPMSKEGAILRAIIDLVTTEDASNNFESRKR